MSKFIQCLLDCARPSMEQKQTRFNHADLALNAFRLYHTAAEQMRSQRTGFTQDYKTTQKMIVGGIASRMSSELAKVNLMQNQQYLAIQQAIAHWNLSTSTSEHAKECQFVKQALLSCLPAARQRQQLRELCQDYKYHLAEDIETQLIDDHPRLYQSYQAPSTTLANKSPPTTSAVKVLQPARSLNRFITTRLQSNSLPESALKKAVVKYEAVVALEKTLQTSQSATQQVQDFQQALQQQKPVLEKHRDSWTTRFLKGVATVLTLGVAACFGIFSVKGEATTQKMQAVLDAPSMALSARD